MNGQIEKLEQEIKNLKDEKAYLEERIECSVEKLERLKNSKEYYINMFGDVVKLRGISSIGYTCMESQGNIFKSFEEAKKEKEKRALKTAIEKFRKECNNGWKPDWNDMSEAKYSIALRGDKFKPVSVYAIKTFDTFGYFETEEDCEKAIELFDGRIAKLYMECE